MTKRLAIIGLDAADTQLIQKWSAQGLLPNIARLMHEGVSVPISTPPAVLEGAVWPTLVSGVSPGTHGMHSYLQLKPESYELHLGLRADQLPVPYFWQLLSDVGKRVVLMDVPLTRPIETVNGIQIVNWGAHDGWSWHRSSWPAEVMPNLLDRFGEHPLSVQCDELVLESGYGELRQRLLQGVQLKGQIIENLIKQNEWDFFFGVFSESHCAGHQCWHLMDRNHPRHSEANTDDLINILRDVYRAIDDAVGRFADHLAGETSFALLLSHGMGAYYHGSHLLDQVIQQLRVNEPDRQSVATKLWKMGSLLPERLRQKIKANIPSSLLGNLWCVSHAELAYYSKMRVFQVPSSNMTSAIRINLKGRDVDGMVEPGAEYEQLCNTLATRLCSLQNPDTGRNAVQWVARSTELFRGSRVDQLPDLFVEWAHDAPIKSLTSPYFGLIHGNEETNRTGSHIPGGSFHAKGPLFSQCIPAMELHTVDLAPTILDFFDIPNPSYLEGRSLLFE